MIETMNEENQILEVINSFILEMNNWEKYCEVIYQDKSLSLEQQLELQKIKVQHIFEKYCTKKDRLLGRPNVISWGHEGSYDYDPLNEEISDVSFNGENQATVSSVQKLPMEQSFKYILKKRKGSWLIDSKKRYSERKEKWEIDSL